jgi:hypothetical protein
MDVLQYIYSFFSHDSWEIALQRFLYSHSPQSKEVSIFFHTVDRRLRGMLITPGQEESDSEEEFKHAQEEGKQGHFMRSRS